MDTASAVQPAPLAPFLYPTPSEAALKLQYVGKEIKDVQAPAAIIDVAVVRRNCTLMLEAADKLDVGFRAHVKTHKVIYCKDQCSQIVLMNGCRPRRLQNCK